MTPNPSSLVVPRVVFIDDKALWRQSTMTTFSAVLTTLLVLQYMYIYVYHWSNLSTHFGSIVWMYINKFPSCDNFVADGAMAPLAAQSPHRGNIIYVLHTSYRHDVIINVKMKITSCQQLPCNRPWWILVVLENANTRRPPYPNRLQPSEREQCFRQYAHSFAVFFLYYHYPCKQQWVYIHACRVDSLALWLPQCQWRVSIDLYIPIWWCNIYINYIIDIEICRM